MHHPHHCHGDECRCGCSHVEIQEVTDLSIRQQNMLLGLYERKYLPLVRFTTGSSKDSALYAIALSPVYMGSKEDTLDDVKSLGAELKALESADLITLDYDIPLEKYSYDEYLSSSLYAYFLDTVKQNAKQEGSLFDTADMEQGSMALTQSGILRVQEMLQNTIAP